MLGLAGVQVHAIALTHILKLPPTKKLRAMIVIAGVLEQSSCRNMQLYGPIYLFRRFVW